MSFTNFNGGLVNTILAGAGNRVSSGITNQLTSNVAFSLNDVLSGAVKDTSGYALDSGSNYLFNQVSGLIPTSLGNGIANAVGTQIASVGIEAAKSFASQTINNILGGQNPFNGVLASATAAQGGFIGLHGEGLPEADYGGLRYTTTDIVFSVVPTNAGPQTQNPVQTSPTVPLDWAFNPNFSSPPPGFPEFKSALAVSGPGSGISTKNFGAIYGNVGKGAAVPSSVSRLTTNLKSIPVSW